MKSSARWVAACVAAAPLVAIAQQPGVSRITGVVLDSTRMAPLSAARVFAVPATTGGRLVAMTDSAGRFQFDSLGLGTYLLDFVHARRDSLGIEVPIVAVALREPGEVHATLGVPSSASVVRTKCGGELGRDGSGVILGTVRRAVDDAATQGAVVVARWRSLVIDGRRLMRDSASAVAQADGSGHYAFCGLPVGSSVALQAAAGGDSSGTISVAMPTERVVRQDLVTGPRLWRPVVLRNAAGDSVHAEGLVGSGRLSGIVVDAASRGIGGAVVSVSVAGRTVTTSSSGAFLLDSLPTGTQLLDVRAIGFGLHREPVHITPTEPPRVTVSLARLGTELDTVKITGTRVWTTPALAGFERRRKAGTGWFADREDFAQQIAVYPSDYVFRAPGVFLRGSGPNEYIAMRGPDGQLCAASIFIDGVRFLGTAIELADAAPTDRVFGVEVYPRAGQIPAEFTNVKTDCGIVAFWTGAPQRPRR